MNLYLRKLVDKLVKTNNKRDMVDLLEALFTPQELRSIPRRLEIIHLIKKGMPQHDIAKKLGVGVATVSRGANEVKLGRFKNV
ncbi:trp operon repressor [Patescibacteria group bacterium]|nr:trp operon repressor [Patescibacteria group bacterium]MBU1683069.1 trp operon repressor [Patescibacteria group bacterium]MBU1935045.1 trp operon repressor [Patescibacteria group bacterium]